MSTQRKKIAFFFVCVCVASYVHRASAVCTLLMLVQGCGSWSDGGTALQGVIFEGGDYSSAVGEGNSGSETYECGG